MAAPTSDFRISELCNWFYVGNLKLKIAERLRIPRREIQLRDANTKQPLEDAMRMTNYTRRLSHADRTLPLILEFKDKSKEPLLIEVRFDMLMEEEP
ncbi:hypothetical protein BOX15_Mlig002987g1 [Macrostomum lignano]|uniref:Uncharacterized protein n=1 Tax=Macrostomum lignano TaxID=282301 RepID=A0A267E0M3_9PLAT|nr:hypothetical protein BOX15_Mlig002987g1 [Macrostomum lignano]